MLRKLFISACVLLISVSIINSQEETLFEKLQENFQTKYFKVGFLFQGVFDHQVERTFQVKMDFHLQM